MVCNKTRAVISRIRGLLLEKKAKGGRTRPERGERPGRVWKGFRDVRNVKRVMHLRDGVCIEVFDVFESNKVCGLCLRLKIDTFLIIFY